MSRKVCQFHGKEGGDPRSHARADFPPGWHVQRIIGGGKSIARAQMSPAFSSHSPDAFGEIIPKFKVTRTPDSVFCDIM